ncbi:MAG: OmpA family protein [Bacteroidia bacterium]|nr:OmpA family protein [Bacteroidia bacterium]
MNARAYLVLFLFVVWSGGSGWYYVCNIKEVCSNDSKGKQSEVPLAFALNNFEPVAASSFDNLKADLLSTLDSSNVLKIVGLYSPSEQNASGFDNLGIARAINVRNLFPEIDDSRFVFEGREQGMDTSHKLMDAVEFEVLIKNAFVQETNFGAVIYFVSSSNNGEINSAVLSYLDKVVQENKGQIIDVVGHSDNAGSEAENFTLALGSANTIKDILVSKGMDAFNVNATSKGETEPIADNNTEEGRAQNRRVEILIN